MAIIAPVPITVLPTVPVLSDISTFSVRTDAFINALPEFRTDTNDIATNVYNNAVEAHADAVATAADAIATAADRVQTGLDAVATAADRVQTGLDVASVTDMGKRYLGAFASNPTLDNQGAALQTGAVCYNTTLAKVLTWNGSAWVEGIASVAGVASVNGATGAVTVQPTLVSGTSIKTINSTSLLGAGDIAISTAINTETRTVNTALAVADKGKLIDLSGNFTQTFQPAATLGTGWYVYLRCLGTPMPLSDTWNGTFASDTLWTKGANWTISSGQAHAAAYAGTDLTSTSSPIQVGRLYRFRITISNRTAGACRLYAGGEAVTTLSYPSDLNADGTYDMQMNNIAASTDLHLQNVSGIFDVDNLQIWEVQQAITLDPNGSELIDGVTSGVIDPGATFLIVCDGTGFKVTRLGPQTTMRVLTSGTSWTCPIGVRAAEVTAIAGGGGSNSTASAGGGGGTSIVLADFTPGTAYSYSIGAGGTATTDGGATSMSTDSHQIRVLGGKCVSNGSASEHGVTPGAGGVLNLYASPYVSATSNSRGGRAFLGQYGEGGAPSSAGTAGVIIIKY